MMKGIVRGIALFRFSRQLTFQFWKKNMRLFG